MLNSTSVPILGLSSCDHSMELHVCIFSPVLCTVLEHTLSECLLKSPLYVKYINYILTTINYMSMKHTMCMRSTNPMTH